MAKLNNSLVPKEETGNLTIQKLLDKESVKGRLEQVLGKRANQFASSIISIVNGNAQLKDAVPSTVLAAAMKAAVLDLPIDANLGFAYIVPYKNKGVAEAQFQLGYKGFVQLALRSSQYKNINVIDVREGELISFNRLSEEIEIDFIEDDEERNKKKVIGYAGFFKLVNGFEKTVYWTVEKIEQHAKKYSFSYQKYNSGIWKDNFDGMARKTVVKLMLSKWGILSIDMQDALEADQAVIGEDDRPKYVDGAIDAEFSEVIEPVAEVVEEDVF